MSLAQPYGWAFLMVIQVVMTVFRIFVGRVRDRSLIKI